MNLSDVVDRTPAFWRKFGLRAVQLVRRLAARGLDFQGQPFPEYSAKYAERKAAGRNKKGKSGASKEVGAGKRQASRQVNPPDLRFTGDMLLDLQMLAVDEKGFVIGWGIYGDRAQWNADRGRALFDFGSDTDPHPKIMEAMHDALSIDTDEKLKKWANKPIQIKVGK